MQSMEERYKKYIEKAKSVIKTLDPKQNPNAVPEVSALRKQLTEKDALIETLEQVNSLSTLMKKAWNIFCCVTRYRQFLKLSITLSKFFFELTYRRRKKPVLSEKWKNG